MAEPNSQNDLVYREEGPKENVSCSTNSEDEDVIVESLVDNAVNAVQSGGTNESRSHVIESRKFVSRSDVVNSEMSGLRIRPESPANSYSSTSFESVHSEELNESCPLIFRVDDVGPPAPTEGSETITTCEEDFDNRQRQRMIKTGKAQSDTVIRDFIPNNGVLEAKSESGEDHPTSMCTDKSYVFESNLTAVESISSNYQPYHIRMSGATEGSPEYIINKLDDQLHDLGKAISGITEKNGQDEQVINVVTRGEIEQVKKLAEITQDTWKEHKKYLLDVLGDFDKIEGKLYDLTCKHTNQCELTTKLKTERRELQGFIEDREKEWVVCEKSLKAELECLRSKLFDISQKNIDSGSVYKMLESLMNLQFNREQAVALDTVKQNKINELRLLVYKQQLVIEELQEDNIFLQQEVASYIASDPLFEETRSDDNYNNNGINSILDVLYCDRYQYLPSYSKHPEFTSLQVFNIGGRHPRLKSAHEGVFNPMKLNINKPPKHYEEAELNELYETLKHDGPASSNFQLDD